MYSLLEGIAPFILGMRWKWSASRTRADTPKKLFQITTGPFSKAGLDPWEKKVVF
jgi:hypothetical protein